MISLGIGLGLGFGATRTALGSLLSMLFRNDELGAFPDLAQSFTDTSGATPATFGDQIARINDQSASALNMVQATLAQRPLLGRAPADAAPGGAIDQGSGPSFIRLDGLDDRLPTAIPAGGTFDVALFGRRGSWIERDVVIAPGGTLTIGPTTFHTAPEGILAAIGDVVGYQLLDRTITETELSRLLAYHRARGAKGLLVPGPDLLVNGEFSTAANTDGWEFRANTNQVISPSGLSLVSGRLRVTNTSAQIHGAYQPITLNTTARYLVTALGRRVGDSTANRVLVGGGITIGAPNPTLLNNTVFSNASTSHVISGAGQCFLALINPVTVNGVFCEFGNISVRELRPSEDW